MFVPSNKHSNLAKFVWALLCTKVTYVSLDDNYVRRLVGAALEIFESGWLGRIKNHKSEYISKKPHYK